jgi:serine/threonine protein kinase
MTRLVADRYLLHEQVGRGGMGVVWRADDQLLGRHVAVKEVHLQPGLSETDRAGVQARVLREARAAAALNHSGAVTVFDVAEDDGQAFIVMELVEAPTLGDLVRTNGALPPPEVARIGIAVLDVLAAAHASGIVHRDLKPANVMVAGDRVKLTDFGIATIKDDPRLTSTGIVLGSPSYISPEQARGEPVTPATDLWGLGATLYYAASARPPFDRGEAIATLTAVAHDELVVDDSVGELAPVLRAMLAKDPADRPSIADLRSRLSAIAEGRGGRTMVLPTLAPTLAAPAMPPRARLPLADAPPVQPPARIQGGRRSRAPWYALLALFALLATVFAFRGLGGGDDPSGDTTARTSSAPKASASARATSRAVGGASQPRTSATSAPRASATNPPAPSAVVPPPAPGVPATFDSYTNDVAGYTVSFPRGWQRVARDRWTTDFREPGTGRYLRVAWTDQPGDDPAQAWRDQAAGFSQRHPGYEEIRIEDTQYKGHDAAIWEFRYSEGTVLHAIDLGFVTGNDRGYALNFQTRDSQWDASQPLWQQLQDAFQTRP